jgi:hypothetical protein
MNFEVLYNVIFININSCVYQLSRKDLVHLILLIRKCKYVLIRCPWIKVILLPPKKCLNGLLTFGCWNCSYIS